MRTILMVMLAAGCGAKAAPASSDTQMFQSWRTTGDWEKRISAQAGVVVLAADGTSHRACDREALAAVRDAAARMHGAACRRIESDAMTCETGDHRGLMLDEDDGSWTVFGVTQVDPESITPEARQAFHDVVEDKQRCPAAGVSSSRR